MIGIRLRRKYPINRLLASFVISFETQTRLFVAPQVDARHPGVRGIEASRVVRVVFGARLARERLAPRASKPAVYPFPSPRSPGPLRDLSMLGPAPNVTWPVPVAVAFAVSVTLRAAVDRQDLGAGRGCSRASRASSRRPVVLVIVTIALPLVVARRPSRPGNILTDRVARGLSVPSPGPSGALFVRTFMRCPSVCATYRRVLKCAPSGPRPGPCPGDSTRPTAMPFAANVGVPLESTRCAWMKKTGRPLVVPRDPGPPGPSRAICGPPCRSALFVICAPADPQSFAPAPVTAGR